MFIESLFVRLYSKSIQSIGFINRIMGINKELLVERLVQRMDLDRIFLFSYSFLGKGQQHLILVMNPADGISPKVMTPVIELCLIDMPDLSFELIPFGEWRNKVRHGGLYYAYASLPRHEIYRSPRKATKSLSANEIGGVIELANQWQIKMKKGGEEFLEGALKFAEHGDYLKATFMVHQSLEFFLRLPQAMIQGKANNQHNLENRMRSLSTHMPAFKTVLLSDAFMELETFRLLDKSYHAVKQNRDLEITAFDASYLYDKCCEISSATEMLFQHFLNGLKAEREKRLEQAAHQEAIEKEKKDSAAKDNKSQQVVSEDFSGFPWPQQYKDDVNMLLDKTRSNHNPEQVVMLNYHTGGFSGNNLFQQSTDATNENGVKVELYLVVLMKNTGPFRFKCIQVGVASAMMVFLDLGYVERKLAEGDRFVHTVWTKGRVLRKKSTFEPNFIVGEVDWKGEYEEVEKILKRPRYVLTDSHICLEVQSVENEINYCVLKSILEAVVISYLRCAVGYIPKDVPLRHLIDWTGVSSRQLIEFLYPKSELEHVQLELFLHPEKMWTKYRFDVLYAGSFLESKKVKQHLIFFDKLLDGVLQKMKGLAEQ